jgi:tetratricopeptide (TPR) repeat protein
MGDIIQLPGEALKLGYKRVRKRTRSTDDPDQLHLFSAPAARVLSFSSAMSPFEEALASDERGDARAADLYLRAIESQDCVADAFCNLGIIETGKGNTVRAFDCFTSSLKHNPRHSEAHYNLANLYFDLGDFRLAQIHFELAGQLDPYFANAYFNLALVQAINHDLAAAITTLTRYQAMVSEDEARHADEFLQSLQESLAATQAARLGSP